MSEMPEALLDGGRAVPPIGQIAAFVDARRERRAARRRGREAYLVKVEVAPDAPFTD